VANLIAFLKNLIPLVGGSWSWVAGSWRAVSIVAAIALTAGLTGGWHLHSVFDAAGKARELQAQIDDQKARTKQTDELATGFETGQAERRQTNHDINERKEKALAQTDPNTNCKLPAYRMHIIADAVTGKSTR
jgi:hypothetical protein